ncbi:helix-turn-helix transcriptional regulator [Hamadaea tsunoensis]|uniref:helix-turn-helix transcriptional regulator n=1 Tax=Hamadaea tsunoensis TaxID=53368 RepID=UPI0003F7FB7F|nr:helix-turn-helix transcriptional regulator [Hamadaea tsunoensis]
MLSNTPDEAPPPGVDPVAIQVLRVLAERRYADVHALADELDLPESRLRTALSDLERDQLAVRTGTDGWAAMPMRTGLGTLLDRRRAELASWEQYARELQETWSASRQGHADGQVELLSTPEQVGAVYAQLLEASTLEVLHLAKPPYVGSPERPAGSAADTSVLQPSLSLRSVYDSAGFTDPVSLHTAFQGRRTHDGRFRLLDGVPFKLALFDRKTALVPADPDDPEAASLIVHAPALVLALAELFESLWARAVPVELAIAQPRTTPKEPDAASDDLMADPGRALTDARTRDILDLMAAGLIDDAIARALGVSRRTVQKHISDLADALGARTRFQIALLAADKGLLGRQRYVP